MLRAELRPNTCSVAARAYRRCCERTCAEMCGAKGRCNKLKNTSARRNRKLYLRETAARTAVAEEIRAKRQTFSINYYCETAKCELKTQSIVAARNGEYC